MMIRLMRHVITEARKLPADDDTTNGEEFVDHYGTTITEQKQHSVKKGALRTITTQGWSTPQKTKWNWCECRRRLRVWFGGPQHRTRSGQQGRSGLSIQLRGGRQSYAMQPPPN